MGELRKKIDELRVEYQQEHSPTDLADLIPTPRGRPIDRRWLALAAIAAAGLLAALRMLVPGLEIEQPRPNPEVVQGPDLGQPSPPPGAKNAPPNKYRARWVVLPARPAVAKASSQNRVGLPRQALASAGSPGRNSNLRGMSRLALPRRSASSKPVAAPALNGTSTPKPAATATNTPAKTRSKQRLSSPTIDRFTPRLGRLSAGMSLSQRRESHGV